MKTTIGTRTDFSEIAQMDTRSKTRIFGYITGKEKAKDLSKIEMEIAAKILIKRLMDPGFMPKELNSCI